MKYLQICETAIISRRFSWFRLYLIVHYCTNLKSSNNGTGVFDTFLIVKFLDFRLNNLKVLTKEKSVELLKLSRGHSVVDEQNLHCIKKCPILYSTHTHEDEHSFK